jgi:hypothetical protein
MKEPLILQIQALVLGPQIAIILPETKPSPIQTSNSWEKRWTAVFPGEGGEGDGDALMNHIGRYPFRQGEVSGEFYNGHGRFKSFHDEFYGEVETHDEEEESLESTYRKESTPPAQSSSSGKAKNSAK